MQQRLFKINIVLFGLLGYVQASVDDYSYCIVVHDSLANVVQPLADWKNEKGCSTFVAKISWIEANYQGRDRAEKIRNFVAHSDSVWQSFEYLLLAGDCGTIPPRYVTLDWYGEECPTPCDDYYANLATNWDLDNDSIFGEDSSECALGIDEIDFNYSLCVGRLPSDNQEEMKNMVEKIIAYEKTPPSGDWQKRIIFCAGYWQWYDSSDCIDFKEEIYASDFPHPNDFQITRLYESMQEDFDSFSVSNFLDAFNQGASIVNVYSHGWKECFLGVIKTDSGWVIGDCIYTTDAKSTTNGYKLPMILACGCETAWFDYDKKCIGESFMTADSGGCIVYLGSSRYNFIPEFYFYPHFFGDAERCAGKAFRMAKQDGLENWGKFNYLTSVMFGDPELKIHTSAAIEERPSTGHKTSDIRLKVYPNPATTKTSINFRVQSLGVGRAITPTLSLRIYDLAGRMIKNWDLEFGDCDFHEIVWDGKNNEGQLVTSGIYFYRLKTNTCQSTKKLIFIR